VDRSRLLRILLTEDQDKGVNGYLDTKDFLERGELQCVSCGKDPVTSGTGDAVLSSGWKRGSCWRN